MCFCGEKKLWNICVGWGNWCEADLNTVQKLGGYVTRGNKSLSRFFCYYFLKLHYHVSYCCLCTMTSSLASRLNATTSSDRENYSVFADTEYSIHTRQNYWVNGGHFFHWIYLMILIGSQIMERWRMRSSRARIVSSNSWSSLHFALYTK